MKQMHNKDEDKNTRKYLFCKWNQ